ncbi:Coenzyme F420 hydrogenase/dehydrogenase, beta subunit C-terminal domain [Jatrophihabitans fulvus]
MHQFRGIFRGNRLFRRAPTADLFHEQIRDVVRAGNCSGCGACAALSPTVTMQLDDEGFNRPSVRPDGLVPADAAQKFHQACPGERVVAPRPAEAKNTDPVLGPYVSAWRAWATADDIRWSGSSGGVITALSAWLVANGFASQVVAARSDPQRPARTVSLRVSTREEIVGTAGSRYAPTSSAALLTDGAIDAATVFVGKPCEVSAASALVPPARSARPVLLSFFCAGVPSQHATDELAEELGVPETEVRSLRYRGQGWPGEFTVVGGAREGLPTLQGRAPYDQAWGEKLGRRIQERCKICPDGMGRSADIAVGDLWDVDGHGYPVFTQGAGTSVALARTARGHDLLRRAQEAGVLVLEPVDAAAVTAVQPSQVRRVRELPGRLIGRRLAGNPAPHYRGFGFWRFVLTEPGRTMRAARGARSRAKTQRAGGTVRP